MRLVFEETHCVLDDDLVLEADEHASVLDLLDPERLRRDHLDRLGQRQLLIAAVEDVDGDAEDHPAEPDDERARVQGHHHQPGDEGAEAAEEPCVCPERTAARCSAQRELALCRLLERSKEAT